MIIKVKARYWIRMTRMWIRTLSTGTAIITIVLGSLYRIRIYDVVLDILEPEHNLA
jgi:hypothetical protein